ncbi:MAG: T9SS type A sorting domain-containing protein, partial [Flavobacteriales bacterium]|nr:T9SS type A sorting domain-containing protein [Flavobacteriales bacterium]
VLLPGAGISEESIDISIYPNPAQNNLYINSSESVDYYITDISGSVVKRGVTGEQMVSVADLQSGAYLVHTSASTSGQVYRFIKQ